jgi:hypothetical protein
MTYSMPQRFWFLQCKLGSSHTAYNSVINNIMAKAKGFERDTEEILQEDDF